jgi:hypothetical protein
LRATNGAAGRYQSPRRGRWSQAEQARLRELYGLRDDAAIARELNRPLASVRRMAERLFASEPQRGPWTASEVMKLKKYLGASPVEVIARVLGREVEEVQLRIMELGRIQRAESWTREEIGELKRIYGTRTNEDLACIFERSEKEIEEVARRLALSKDKAFVCKLNGEASTRMPRWRMEELEILRREYPVCPNLLLARKLERSVKSVVSKAHNMGLRKSSDRLREMGRENVSLRYREVQEQGAAQD